MSMIKVYQPWSTPVLHARLSDKLLDELIELTDLIAEDKERESANEHLAGEIEEEWKIDVVLLTNISFKDYVIQLCWEYLKNMISQYYIETNLPKELILMKQIIQNIQIVSAWFNDQKDNEYNPMHNHNGYFSGVLYLKIPEYLPSRKTIDTDGTISFFGGSAFNSNDLMTTVFERITPKIGDIFLFPATLMHQVYPFRTIDGKGIRRSISFNLDTIEKIE